MKKITVLLIICAHMLIVSCGRNSLDKFERLDDNALFSVRHSVPSNGCNEVDIWEFYNDSVLFKRWINHDVDRCGCDYSSLGNGVYLKRGTYSFVSGNGFRFNYSDPSCIYMDEDDGHCPQYEAVVLFDMTNQVSSIRDNNPDATADYPVLYISQVNWDNLKAFVSSH